MASGIVISSDIPVDIPVSWHTWLRYLPDGSKEYYEDSGIGWTKVWTEAAPALLNHSHPTHGDINFTGTVSADGDTGLTGQRTVGGYKFTFKKGLLVGFEQA